MHGTGGAICGSETIVVVRATGLGEVRRRHAAEETKQRPLDANFACNEGKRGSHGWEAGGHDTSRHFDGGPSNGPGKSIGWIRSVVLKQDRKAVSGCKDNAVVVMRLSFCDERGII
jgi:hypothetical protein